MKRNQSYSAFFVVLAVFAGAGAMGRPIENEMTEVEIERSNLAETERSASEESVDECTESERVSYPEVTNEELAVLGPYSAPAENRFACLAACRSGPAAIQTFCRVIPHPAVRAACWAVVFAGRVACSGFCYLYF